MPLHEVRVTPIGDDPIGSGTLYETWQALGIDELEAVQTAKVYRLEGVNTDQATELAKRLLADPVSERFVVDGDVDFGVPETQVVEVGYLPGVMNPEASSIVKSAHDLGIELTAVDSSREFAFVGNVSPEQINNITGRLLVNKTVQRVVPQAPSTLLFEGVVGPVNTVPIREAGDEVLDALSKDKLFLNTEEMRVVQRYFKTLDRDPTDAELEIIAARWSEHCGHKTFNAKVMVDGVEKPPLFTRIKRAAERHFGDLVVSAFDDNSGVIRFYNGGAICGKVETHNSPSAIEPRGGAMTGSGGVFRDIMGTGQGAETILSTDMFCLAPPYLDSSLIPTGTLDPLYLQKKVVQGVSEYGNRMGIPTANGSLHFHPDFRAKPTVIVGAYGLLEEARAQKGVPELGDLVVIIGGKTGRDGIHGATFSSGEMTHDTAQVNSSAVQIGNAIEEKRMFDALIEARDLGLIRAITDCGAAGFSSAIGEIGEEIGLTVDISKAPTKYPGLAPWEIWLSESQERMVSAISPDNIQEFLKICKTYNVEAVVLGEFDGSNTMTVKYGDQTVADLDYDFLKNGLPQRVMTAHWEKDEIDEVRPEAPVNEEEWISRFKAVLAHGNVCSKEPIVRKYDHGVQGGNIVAPYGGVNQNGPNDAVVIRPILNRPYGFVQSHGMNPILNRIDPYQGTLWAFAEAAANYVSAGGDITQAAAVGNYIWPFPDEAEMGSLDRSVDAAVDAMDALEVPVISGKDSLSSTYRGADGEVIKIPPVHAVSIFGRIPDVEKTMTTALKKNQSDLVLIGSLDSGMGGSTYYDVNNGSSGRIPQVDIANLKKVLERVHEGIVGGQILSCHDVSEGGLAATVAEMCIGGDLGANLWLTSDLAKDPEHSLFNETAGCFVVEIDGKATAETLLNGIPHRFIGQTTTQKQISVYSSQGSQSRLLDKLFEVSIEQLTEAWQTPMNEVYLS